MWEIAVHLAAASDVFDGVFLCCPFSHEMCWMRSGTELSQFLRVSYLLWYALVILIVLIVIHNNKIAIFKLH